MGHRYTMSKNGKRITFWLYPDGSYQIFDKAHNKWGEKQEDFGAKFIQLRDQNFVAV